MLLAEYLNSQFSFAQNLDFFIRIAAACLCGALIGAERSRRYKGAGIRTHIIVCCAASLMMIAAKYGFADLTDEAGIAFSGANGADSSQIAAQVVSGISFLGTGVIFKHGSTVQGLTTAAGLWATAGIGLAVGAGMYPLGIFTAVFIALLQVLMHKYVAGKDFISNNHLQFTVRTSESFQNTLATYMQERKIQVTDSKITYHDDGYVSYDIVLRAPREVAINELDQFIKSCGELRCISYIPIS